MYRHLNRFTSRTGATNTHTKAQRKENLPSAAGEPSPALSSSARAGPPQAACGASRPRLPPTGRATSAGTSEEEGSASQRQRMNREEERAYERRRSHETRARPASVRPSWSGAPPFAPPRFWLHLPSGSFPKRGVPHSRQRHPARPPIGGEPPHPASVTLLGENRREKSARLSELLWFPFAFDDV